jgi:hypothetical protein
MSLVSKGTSADVERLDADAPIPYRPTEALIDAQVNEVGVVDAPDARIFVAGAMAEIGRVVLAMRALRRCIGPECITHDWTIEVLAALEAGRPDESLPHERRVEIALGNAHGIRRAGCFWLCASRLGVDSWGELGYAIARRDDGHPMHVVVSGGAASRSLNADRADVLARHDFEGLYAVADWARGLARGAEAVSP